MPELILVAGLVITGLSVLALAVATYRPHATTRTGPRPPAPDPRRNGHDPSRDPNSDLVVIRSRDALAESPLYPLHPCHSCGRNSGGFDFCPWCHARQHKGGAA